MKRRKVIVGLVFLALAAGLGWLVMRQTRTHTFTLPDGSHLFLRGVTVGSNVPMNFGSGLEKVLARVPGKAGAKFRRNVWTDEADSGALVFWFEFDQPPASNSMVEVEFIDLAQRRQFQAQSWLAVHQLPNGKVIATSSFPAWPRHEKSLAIRIDLYHPVNGNPDEGERHDLGKSTVKNPGYRP